MVESTPIPHICLDVCCLNRPFDDQRQDRIRLEAEAVLLIVGRCEAGTWQWLSSAVVEEEINNTPSRERRSRVRNMLSGAQSTVALTDVAIARAQELKAMGFAPTMPSISRVPSKRRSTSFSPPMIACSASPHATPHNCRSAWRIRWRGSWR
jgi:hypothetical protein